MSGSLQAAVATEDITPEAGCALAAYHRAEKSRGILDPLELGALVLRSERSLFVWITVDNVFSWSRRRIRSGARLRNYARPLRRT